MSTKKVRDVKKDDFKTVVLNNTELSSRSRILADRVKEFNTKSENVNVFSQKNL